MDVTRLCSDLVKIRSENPPGNTEAAVHYIGELLAAGGIRFTTTKCRDGRSNLITEPAGTGLLLCGHVDVVPAIRDGWSVDPFSGILRDGSVWGRGATDMKGGCAALISAFMAFVEANGQAPAQLAFVCDEETGGDCGIRHLVAHHLVLPCDCLIAEPTPALHPNIGQKGLVRLEMRFSGSPGHGSLYPAIGRSAIAEALSFMQYIGSLPDRKFPHSRSLEEIISRSSNVLSEEFGLPHTSEILTSIMFNPGIIAGGEKSNIVAQRCDLDLEMRIPWGCDIPALIDDLRKHAPYGTIVSETSHTPSLTDPESRIVTAICRAVEKTYGRPASPIVQWAASDARHLRAAGFRVAEYGPGELRLLHAIDEHVKTESLEKAVTVYLAVMQDYVLQKKND
ncbi:MAG: putative metallohydrolase [Methanoregula sp. PtaU1.Bin051]|nr:MAG: putative metallohydrolase [Methanoregula sp. PtaU1.Bin051]